MTALSSLMTLIRQRMFYVHSELWEENFEDTLRPDIWEVRNFKQKLYGEDTCPSHHQCQTLAEDAGPVTGGGWLRVIRWAYTVMQGSDYGSAHCSGCVVNGISAKDSMLSIIAVQDVSLYNIHILEFVLSAFYTQELSFRGTLSS